MTSAVSMHRFVLGEIVIGSPQWVVPGVVIGVVLTALVLWNYFGSGAIKRQFTWLAMLLKLAGVFLIVVCLVQPMRRATRPRPKANLLPIVVDTSRSMDLAIGRSESWRNRIDETLATESPVFSAMAQAFETRIYGFDKRITSVGEVTDLERGGRSSRMLASLKEIEQRLDGKPVAGLLLMSDGNDAMAPPSDQPLPEFAFPIFPVIPSGTENGFDLRVVNASVRQTNFEISPVTLTVRYRADNQPSGGAVARLTDIEFDTVIEEQKIDLSKVDEASSVTFQFRPLDVGLRFYRFDLFRDSDSDAFDDLDALIETPSSETTLMNNTQLIAVNRERGPYRVLYVSGRPNWEFKFLKRAITEDAEVELRGLIRMAKKKPKFSFRDREVSSTNPLFQGLGNEAEEAAEQYDEPVVIRIDVESPDELASGFPITAEELFHFDALILDDLEPSFFTRDQQALVRQFVSRRGGGLLMLAGEEMYAGKQFSDSVLGELSPVYVGRASENHSGPYTLGLTREGLLQPWLRLRENASLETIRLRKMPAFRSVNEVGELKPGAYQFATVADSAGNLHPAVAVHRFGKGKVGAVTVSDFWRWSMRREAENEDDPAQAWRQVVRWLVGDVPRRTAISVQQSKEEPDRMEIRIDVVDEDYQPLENCAVQVDVIGPDKKPLALETKPIGEIPGAYSVSYFGDQPGTYRVTAEVRSADGAVIGTPESGWTRQLAGSEFDQVGTNRALLARIAETSGGSEIREADLAQFSNRLESGKVPVTETWVYPLWHRGWVIALALGCLCGEWGLRRLGGMA